ncbi:MAG TPA: energy transducer TonB [Rhizomicrobium sp.]|nr:energy transducer TonB [Rhizomicrobium sp.]
MVVDWFNGLTAILKKKEFMRTFAAIVTTVLVMLLGTATTSSAQDATTCIELKALGPQFRLKAQGAHDVQLFRAHDTDKREGTVVMNVDIASDGSVKAVDIISSSGSQYFDTHAAEYVKQRWRWWPPIHPETGQPIEVCTRVFWRFRA